MSASVRVIFSDVDGTLTDGKLWFGGGTSEPLKAFHVHDGMGIHLWNREDRVFGFLSARDSQATRMRAAELGVTAVGLGVGDKLSWMEEWLSAQGYSWSELAYIGDDVNDLPVMRKAAFSAIPGNAPQVMHAHVSYICRRHGGEGAVRELIDHLAGGRLYPG